MIVFCGRCNYEIVVNAPRPNLGLTCPRCKAFLVMQGGVAEPQALPTSDKPKPKIRVKSKPKKAR
jgi:hypothetical protein